MRHLPTYLCERATWWRTSSRERFRLQSIPCDRGHRDTDHISWTIWPDLVRGDAARKSLTRWKNSGYQIAPQDILKKATHNSKYSNGYCIIIICFLFNIVFIKFLAIPGSICVQFRLLNRQCNFYKHSIILLVSETGVQTHSLLFIGFLPWPLYPPVPFSPTSVVWINTGGTGMQYYKLLMAGFEEWTFELGGNICALTL